MHIRFLFSNGMLSKLLNQYFMYSKPQLALKYLSYYFTASNGKGHGIHSPFVFNLVTKVLNDKSQYTEFEKIELLRKQLLSNKTILEIEDFGAGSVKGSTKKRRVQQIASVSLKPKKYAQLLYKLVKYVKPKTILELGTSLGLTSAYLASANKEAQLITIEGAPSIAAIAKENLDHLQLQNVHLITGNFDETLETVLAKKSAIDFVFIDGNHRKEPTLRYFEQLLKKSTEQSLFVFDDIHWSRDMNEAWTTIKNHSSVTLTIDLFFIGLVFFRKEQKVKQHFTIRF